MTVTSARTARWEPRDPLPIERGARHAVAIYAARFWAMIMGAVAVIAAAFAVSDGYNAPFAVGLMVMFVVVGSFPVVVLDLARRRRR